jgi:hypothetical protein
MRLETPSLGRRTVDYVKDMWAEFDYAQRRLLEVQTGRPMTREGRKAEAQIDELEALYWLESAGPDH